MNLRRLAKGLALLAGSLALPVAARAQGVGPFEAPPAAEARPSPARLALGDALRAAPLVSLPPARSGAPAELAALAARNASGRLPLQVGFARPLSVGLVQLQGVASPSAAARPFARGLLMTDGGRMVWGTHVRVEEAHRLRLHLAGVQLPADSRMRVSAPGGPVRGFGLELRSPAGDLWTPSVAGPSLLFEVDVPAGAGAARFALREAMELIDRRSAAAWPRSARGSSAGALGVVGDTSCLVDASCVDDSVLPNVASYRHAMAQLDFVSNGGAFACSGGLLNDAAGDATPYLLTAHHCFSDASAAASLEATFDFYTVSCNGPAPDESTEPRANGATLLASRADSDFTFIRLANLPAGRTFLGWNADAGALQQGTALYRLSFPLAFPEVFSRYAFESENHAAVCSGAPQPQFLYSAPVQGASAPGSSGSPLLLGNGQVVGQLFGACGSDPRNPCDFSNSDVDGAFAVTYPWIAAWLDPSSACYALALGHSGSGSDPVATPSGSPGCPAGSFTAGTAIGLLASPAPGWVVSGWSGTDADTAIAAGNSLTMPAMSHSASVSYQPTGFYTLSPCRLVDTRAPAGPTGAPALQPFEDRGFGLAGLCGIPAGARAVALNVTITQPLAPGDLRFFPLSPSPAPLDSTINFGPGQTRANNAILELGSGFLVVRNDSTMTVHLILDVNGYFE